MFSLKSLFLAGALISTVFQVSAFTIINQTNSDKVLRLSPAERVERKYIDKESREVHEVEYPIVGDAISVTVKAKSIQQIMWKQKSPAMVFEVITKEKRTKNVFTSVTDEFVLTTCYQAYCLCDNEQCDHLPVLDNSWGIVIHKPIPYVEQPYSSHSYFSNFFEENRKKDRARRQQEQGYGVQCLHPVLLDKVVSVDELPAELID